MSSESQHMAGVLIAVLPTVVFGGVSILYLWLGVNSDYMKNPLRQSLWRAGHAHAGVLLVVSLVALLYVDSAALSDDLKWLVRNTIPLAAIFLPAAFFLSVLKPDATKPNVLIKLAYVGAVLLVTGRLTLGIGLINAA